MTRILNERDRLLAFSARCVGMTSSATALACVTLTGAVDTPVYVVVLIGILLLGFCQSRLAAPSPIRWIVATIVFGDGLIVLLTVTGPPDNPASICTVTAIAGGSVASIAIMMVTSRYRMAALVVAFAVTATVTWFALADQTLTDGLVWFVSVGWVACTLIGIWLNRALPRVMHRISSVGEAYNAERRASETEVRRRQGARLLHDTVLATLTMLAHSGVGVGADALREQAGHDAALLRQLRLGSTPAPQASGSYTLKPVDESALGNTLESVKQRFRRMGLEVSWHGSGHVLLPSDVLDDFLLALGECLENVRRHSGVAEAQVTITDDDQTVRAMVTDAGVGFDLDEIDAGRLGYTESIVARLRDVGGNARLFSSPGSGTTVVLEVPK